MEDVVFVQSRSTLDIRLKRGCKLDSASATRLI